MEYFDKDDCFINPMPYFFRIHIKEEHLIEGLSLKGLYNLLNPTVFVEHAMEEYVELTEDRLYIRLYQSPVTLGCRARIVDFLAAYCKAYAIEINDGHGGDAPNIELK